MNDLANVVTNDELELKRLKKLRRSRRKERRRAKSSEALAADQQPIELEQPTKASGNSQAIEPQPQETKPEKTEKQKQAEPKRHLHWPLACLAAGLAIVGLLINGYFSWTRGTSDLDKILFASLGGITECVMFFLPAAMAEMWRQRRLGAFLIACICLPCLFAFALTNSLGFASVNLNDVATARSERQSPAIVDSQRRVDTLTASRQSECRKRGDNCRALEKEEQTALDTLALTRQSMRAEGDPQAFAAQKLVSWLTAGSLTPKIDDFSMLRLLLLTVLTQSGGIILMLARR